MSISRNFIIHAPKGGELHVVDTETGEVVTTFAILPGRHRASQWFDLVGPGEALTPGKGVTASLGRSGVTRQFHPQHSESDANPDFQPLGQADKLVQAMQRQLAIMSATNKANNARAAKAAALERIPDAPLRERASTVEDAPVVE